MQQLIEFTGNHAMLAAGFVAVILLLVWTEIGRQSRGYNELSPMEAVRLINQDGTSIVDISTTADFSKGHLAGSKHFSLSRFSNPDAEIEKLKNGPVLVVCKTGQSAHRAATQLVKLGANNVTVLKGGTTQWVADQYPLA